MGIAASELSEALSSVVEKTGNSVLRIERSRRRPVSGLASGMAGDSTAVVSNGSESFKAAVKGIDAGTDIALLELEALVTRVAPAVVALEHRRGNGSGVMLTAGAFVLTCAHVVKDTERVRVRYHDGWVGDGEVVGRDAVTDLALLATGQAGVTTLPLAGVGQVNVGQVVLTLGHPYELERSVSLGVVSAIERQLPTGRDGPVLDGLIQTDAAINPVNSGGPLLNVRGLVAGINTAMMPWAQGIGFAVPSSTVHRHRGEKRGIRSRVCSAYRPAEGCAGS